MATRYNYTGGIVTNGLVLNLDAAKVDSYPGTGTTWYDISGNNNSGSLVNGPTFSGIGKQAAIVFDGTNDYAVSTTTTPTSLQGNPSFTVEGWFKRNGSWSDGATWGIGGNGSQQGINSYTYPDYSNQISIDLWGTSTYTTAQTYSLTDWKHIVWTYNGGGFTTSNIIIYINTVPYTGASLTALRGGSGTPNINSSGIVLARAGVVNDAYYSPCTIANFRIYSRVLSATEVSQNFNALRGRYGI
jgi:hypothetical protein